MFWLCSIETMGVSKLPEGGKEKTMEVWYFCRYLPGKVTGKSDGKMDAKLDSVGDDGGGRSDVTLDASVFSGQDMPWETLADMGSLDTDTSREGGEMEPDRGGGGGGGVGVGLGVPRGESITGGDNSVEQQLVMIEEMVHEMKQGFVIAMEELTKIQEGDHHLQRRMQDHRDTVDSIIQSFREQQRTQKTELLAELRRELQEEKKSHQPLEDMITALKSEVSTVSGHLREVLDLQKGLQERVNVLHTERNILLEELVRNGAVSDKVRGLLHKNSSSSIQELGVREGELVSMEEEATASACKCLSLLQALEERCILPDMSDSSDEEVSHRTQPWKQNPSESTSLHQNIAAADAYTDFQSQDPAAAERYQCVQDTIDSEREYCTQLWSLLDGYLGPLQEGLYISTRELNILFPPYLNQMYDEHCNILNLLEDRLQHGSYGGLVGDIFAKMTDTQTGNLISLYKEYLTDFPPAITCLRRQIAQSKKFRAFIKREDRPNSGDIIPLLTAPIRRIPQYSLLLQQLLKNTPVSHPDHYALQSTLSRLRGFVDQFSDDIKQIVRHDKDGTRSGQSFRSSPSGSSCETGGQPASARDSGIHSNGEESHPHHAYTRSATPDWVEMTGNNFRDPRLNLVDHRLSARSQPDLTFGRFSTSQLTSQSYKRDFSDNMSGRSPLSDKMSHHRRYKLKKKGDRQGSHYRPGSSMSQASLPPDYGSVYPSRHRPASAIDFISRHDSSQLRHSREHLHNRPQSALGMSSGRRTTHQSATRVGNRSFQTNGLSIAHPPISSSYPSQRGYSPYPQDSPRILVNGQRRESFHGSNGGSDYGVYGDEDHDLVSAHTMKYRDNSQQYVDSGHPSEFTDEMDLAVSLADSLNHNDNANIDVEVLKQQDTSPRQDGRGSALDVESVSTHNKSDRSMHSSDLHINLPQDIRSDVEEPRVPKPTYTDSSDQPNSSFEESVRSESRNSEHKTEESSEPVITSQSVSPEHSSQADTTVESRVTTTASIPVPSNNNNNSLRFANVQTPNSFDNSVVSFDERLLSNHQRDKQVVIERQQSERQNTRSRNPNRLSSPFPQSRPADFAPELNPIEDETDSQPGKKDPKKKKDKTKRYNSMENLSKSSEDVNAKKTFKSSLKHFFGKKNGLLPSLQSVRVKQQSDPQVSGGSVRMDKLEAQFAKEHGLDHIPNGESDKGANPVNNNNDSKIPLVKLLQEQTTSIA